MGYRRRRSWKPGLKFVNNLKHETNVPKSQKIEAQKQGATYEGHRVAEMSLEEFIEFRFSVSKQMVSRRQFICQKLIYPYSLYFGFS